MLRYRSKLIACQWVIFSLVIGSGIVFAAPPDPPLEKAPPPAKADPKPPVEMTRVPVEFSVSVADLEKQMLRGIVHKIDPKAKPELPIVVKGNFRDLREKASDKSAATDGKDATKPDAKEPEKAPANPNKVVVLPAPEQPPVQPVVIPPGRPRLLGRPIGSRVVEKVLIRPAIDMVVDTITKLPDLDYRIELRSVKLAISGQTLTCEIGGAFHTETKAPAAQPGQSANPPPTVHGDIGLKLTVTKELVWSDSGKLELKEGKSQVSIDPDSTVAALPKLDVSRVVQWNGLPTLVDGVVDRLVMMQLSGANMPDLTQFAPKFKDKLPFVAITEITAYPLRSDSKDLFIPLTVGLVPSNKKTGDEVKTAAKTGTPPEPQVRGKITFDADGKPAVKLDPVK